MVAEVLEPFAVDAEDPYGHYARLREAAPVHRVRDADGNEAWLVTRYEDVKAAFADPRITSDLRVRHEARRRARPEEPIPPPSDDVLLLLRSAPPEHGPLRRATNAGLTFSPRQIAALRPRAERIADDLLDALDEHGETELHRRFALPLVFSMICELLGIPPDEARELPLPLDTDEDFHDIDAYLAGLIARKRRDVDLDLAPDAQPDHLSAMIAHRDEHGSALPESRLVALATLVFGGGTLPAAVIVNGVRLLTRHPEQRRLLVERPELVESAVEEILRFEENDEHGKERYAAEDVEIGGVKIPKWSRVFLLTASANRDPARFPDPDRFDITRPDNHHLTFGRGIHFCLGVSLSKLDVRVALGTLLRRFPDVAPVGATNEPGWEIFAAGNPFGLTRYRPSELLVRLRPDVTT